MLRNLLSSRWFQGGLAFFLFCVGVSLLYSWHVRRTTETELERSNRFSRGTEQQKATRPAEKVIAPTENETPGLLNTPEENTDTQMSDTGEAFPHETETLDLADAFLPEGFVSEEAPAEDVPVSPFGFGPYPKLPEGWEADFPPVSVKHELMVRVAVKLREQGIDVAGASMEDGFVFPNIKGIYYVKWDETDEGVKYITEGTGHPEDGNRLHAIRMEKGEPLTETDIPADIKLVSYEEGRIEPYEFLDLQR